MLNLHVCRNITIICIQFSWAHNSDFLRRMRTWRTAFSAWSCSHFASFNWVDGWCWTWNGFGKCCGFLVFKKFEFCYQSAWKQTSTLLFDHGSRLGSFTFELFYGCWRLWLFWCCANSSIGNRRGWSWCVRLTSSLGCCFGSIRLCQFAVGHSVVEVLKCFESAKNCIVNLSPKSI